MNYTTRNSNFVRTPDRVKMFRRATAPDETYGLVVGDLWMDTGSDPVTQKKLTSVSPVTWVSTEGGGGGGGGAPTDLTYVTFSDETATLPNSFSIVAGDGILISSEGQTAVITNTSTGGAGLIGPGSATGSIKNDRDSANNSADGQYSTALGSQGSSGYDYSFSAGFACNAGAVNAIAMGYFSSATGDNSIALSSGLAVGANSVAINSGHADGANTFSFGTNSYAEFDYSMVLGDSSGLLQDSATQQLILGFTGGTYILKGPLTIGTVGNGLSIAEGSDAKMGVATLSGGVVAVATTAFHTATSRVFLTAQDAANGGALYIDNVVDGSGFNIKSTVPFGGDVAWLIIDSI